MRTLLAVLVAAAFASPLASQSGVQAFGSVPSGHPTDARLAIRPTPVPAERFTVLDTVSRRPLRPALRALGGAVLGAWVGFIASQVSRSDWDQEEDGDFTSYRVGFAVGGAAVGAVAGLVMGRTARHEVARSPAAPTVEKRAGERITAEEVARSTANNAGELIKALRPRWLQGRGANTFRETARGVGSGPGRGSSIEVVPGTGTIRVYLDDVLLGDVSVLNQVNRGSFVEARYFDPAAATYRWGAGHTSGAIQLLTSIRQQ
jgi:hypothetical protein